MKVYYTYFRWIPKENGTIIIISLTKHNFMDTFYNQVKKIAKQRAFLFLFLGVFLLSFIIIPILLTQFSGCVIFDSSSGVIGDTIGGIVGPIVAFCGVVLTFMAFYVQHKANLIQYTNFTSQQNDNIFFHMLQTLQTIKENITIRGGVDNFKRELHGKDAFVEIAKQLKNFDEQGIKADMKTGLKLDQNNLDFNDNRKKQIEDAWKRFYSKHKNSLSDYFIYVYVLLKNILSNSSIDTNKKRFYLSQIQAQLYGEEVVLLFYNSISHYSLNRNLENRFKFWLDSYSILENMNPDNLHHEYDFLFYSDTNFKYISLFQKGRNNVRQET